MLATPAIQSTSPRNWQVWLFWGSPNDMIFFRCTKSGFYTWKIHSSYPHLVSCVSSPILGHASPDGWVRRRGGGLFICQPNSISTPQPSPSDLEFTDIQPPLFWANITRPRRSGTDQDQEEKEKISTEDEKKIVKKAKQGKDAIEMAREYERETKKSSLIGPPLGDSLTTIS